MNSDGIYINREGGLVDKEYLTSRRIRMEVSNDAYEAYVIVDERDPQLSDIQAALEANGIVYGIDPKELLTGISLPGRRVLVATGTRHTDGIDGFFVEARGRTDWEAKNRFGIRNFYAGDTVGVIHKPTTGIVGIDIYGRKVQPKQGRPMNMLTGPNIKRIDTEDEIRLEAAADGNLSAGEASIDIIGEHTVHGDIDYFDGELEFAGTLRITGDVKGSSRLKVKHDVYVQGSVEDAEIIAGGNVTVNGSFVGRGDGLIRAGGNAEVHVVLNQMIEARGSVTIGKESINARIIAANSILAKNAIMMGGTMTAGEKIEVQTLGGDLYPTTKVKLGLEELLIEDASAIDKEIEIQTQAIDRLKNEIYILVRDRIDSKNFTAEKLGQLKTLQAELQRQNETVKQLNAKKQQKAVEISRKRRPRLTVLGTVHQSVTAEINGVRIPLKQSSTNVTFEELRNDIIRTRNL